MNYFTIYGAALLLALLIASPVLDKYFKPFGDWKPKPWRLWDLWASELGAVSVTYYVRGGNVAINGSTTAPTAGQANQVMKQSAVIVWGVTADTAARFTHNWGLDGSAPTFYEPEVLIYQLSDTTAAPSLLVDVTNSNVTVITKAATAAPVTCLVTLRRPHSSGQ
jgi:hypothetical protein